MRRIYYYHIPKTGGQTLALRLASGFPAEQVDVLGPSLRFPKDLGKLRDLLKSKYFVERHSSGPLPRTFGHIDLLTTIRDPVSHIASHYLHIRREPQSEMHRAANTLSTADFFSAFGDLLANFQVRSLVNAFCTAPEYKAIDWTQPDTWCGKLPAIFERLRWIVPTEDIDEFVALWRLELRRQIPYTTARINVAPKDRHRDELLNLIRERTELYFADTLLWQCARSRFADYRERVLRSLTPIEDSENANRCFWNGHGGIWLLSGWHFPETNGDSERHWWAGRESSSEVAYLRRQHDRYLHFDVGIFCGISHKDIWVTAGNGMRRLPLIKERSGKVWSFWIDLQNQPTQGSLRVRVPHVLAPILVDPESNDIRRLSFAAQGWSLEPAAPAKRLRKLEPRPNP